MANPGVMFTAASVATGVATGGAAVVAAPPVLVVTGVIALGAFCWWLFSDEVTPPPPEPKVAKYHVSRKGLRGRLVRLAWVMLRMRERQMRAPVQPSMPTPAPLLPWINGEVPEQVANKATELDKNLLASYLQGASYDEIWNTMIPSMHWLLKTFGVTAEDVGMAFSQFQAEAGKHDGEFIVYVYGLFRMMMESLPDKLPSEWAKPSPDDDDLRPVFA